MIASLLSASFILTMNCAPADDDLRKTDTTAEAEASAEELLAKIWRERRTHDLAWRELKEIEALGEDAAPALIRLIESPTDTEMKKGQSCSDAEMKIGALLVLGRWKYQPAFDLVARCARGDDISIRPSAMVVMEEINHSQAYPGLLSGNAPFSATAAGP
jgi:hypothetical protein